MHYFRLAPVAALIIATSACNPKAEPLVEESRPVWSVEVGVQKGSIDAIYSGDVRARYENKLSFRIGGKIAQRLVEVGSSVQRGQVLMRLQPDDSELNVASNRAQHEAAQARMAKDLADLQRGEELFAQQFISQAELDQLRLGVRQSQAQFNASESQLQLAENHYHYTELRADRDGVITAINAESGQVVAAGQTLLTLAASGERELAISVPESRVDELRHAQNMTVTLWATPDKHYRASLREMAPATDEITRTYAARIHIENPDASLRLGMTASLHVPNINRSDAIRLPLTAVFTQQNQNHVWVIHPDEQRVYARAVVLGAVQNDQVLIQNGLSSGESVVVAGATLLHEKQLVKNVANKG